MNNLIQRMYFFGLGAPLAAMLTLRSRLVRKNHQHFHVDSDGHWLNHEGDEVLVDRRVNTSSAAERHAIARESFFPFYQPTAGDIVIEAGAGIGEETVILSKLVGSRGRVIAIEAQPETFACLKKTVEKSGCKNVTCLNIAIGGREGTIEIGDDQNHLGSSIVSGSSSANRANVRLTTIDQVVADEGLTSVNFLKMNIEGAECEAIRGVQTCAPMIAHCAISCHDFLADRGSNNEMRTLKEVSRLLREKGFEIRRIEDYRPWVRDYLYASQVVR